MDYKFAQGSVNFEMGEEKRQICHVKDLVNYG